MTPKINRLFLSGVITNVRVSTPNSAEKQPSAIITVKYGEPRAQQSAVQYVPSVEIRIPSFQYPKLKDNLVVGKFVKIHGHLQGVLKKHDDHEIFTAELVADRISLHDQVVGMDGTFFMGGELKRLQVIESRDPKKLPFAILLVQYGPERDATGGKVEFVNAVQIRIPAPRFAKIKDKLEVGSYVLVDGEIQGVVRTLGSEMFYSTELNAEGVSV